MVAATQMSGGGISSFGKLTVNSGVISGNDAHGTAATRGGGVYQNGTSGAATFRRHVIAGNSARTSARRNRDRRRDHVFEPACRERDLGRPRTEHGLGQLTSTTAQAGLQQGGGVYGLNPSRIRVVNSTVSGNMAPDAGGDGGGIDDNGVQLDVHHSTFAENQAADQADAVNLEPRPRPTRSRTRSSPRALTPAAAPSSPRRAATSTPAPAAGPRTSPATSRASPPSSGPWPRTGPPVSLSPTPWA